MSHESHRLGAYYFPVIKKSLSLSCLYLVTKIAMCKVIYCLLLIVHMTTMSLMSFPQRFFKILLAPFLFVLSLQKHINTNIQNVLLN